MIIIENHKNQYKSYVACFVSGKWNVALGFKIQVFTRKSCFNRDVLRPLENETSRINKKIVIYLSEGIKESISSPILQTVSVKWDLVLKVACKSDIQVKRLFMY